MISILALILVSLGYLFAFYYLKNLKDINNKTNLDIILSILAVVLVGLGYLFEVYYLVSFDINNITILELIPSVLVVILLSLGWWFKLLYLGINNLVTITTILALVLEVLGYVTATAYILDLIKLPYLAFPQYIIF